MPASYSVGIDLGTTNSVISTLALEDADGRVGIQGVEQITQPGQVESFDSLPSFLYLPRDGECDALRSDFQSEPHRGIAGHYAKRQAADNPERVVVAAKSWLCHHESGRTGAVLPWQSPTEVQKVSAMEATQTFLEHLIAAWQKSNPGHQLRDQHVTLTVPASF
ncbi:MAG: Hsp70 family protein, partial [Planctomycetota bacterium]